MSGIDYAHYPHIRHNWVVSYGCEFVMYMTATFNEVAELQAVFKLVVDWGQGRIDVL